MRVACAPKQKGVYDNNVRSGMCISITIPVNIIITIATIIVVVRIILKVFLSRLPLLLRLKVGHLLTNSLIMITRDNVNCTGSLCVHSRPLTEGGVLTLSLESLKIEILHPQTLSSKPYTLISKSPNTKP